ncbi:VWA domain-containing protein [bacterium]|nr:VWA domain-containing protein [bacterium]
MEYYACSRQEGYTERRMELSWVEDAAVQDCVRGIEQLVRHYSRRTEDFLEFINEGPDYLDFVAMEETDVICLNTGGSQGEEQCIVPQERLVAIYPKEGTFVHGHPMAVVNADWVTPEQAAAGEVFIEFVLMEAQQEYITSYGFRPANPNVQAGFMFTEENGVQADFNTNIIAVPNDDVLIALQENWSLVRKQADVWLVIDVSGSMQEDGKLDQAKAAALAFLDNMDTSNRVGLAVFSDEVRVLVPLSNFETNAANIRNFIGGLRAVGGTELYGAVRDVVQLATSTDEGDRIRAVVLLSDGEHTGDSGLVLADATDAIRASRDSANPIILVPVAYGSGADVSALNSMAGASNTRVIFGDPNNINEVLQIISSYF